MTKTRRPRKPEPSNIRGLCVECGKREQAQKGGGLFKAICKRCDKRAYLNREKANRSEAIRRHPYKAHRKDRCEECGFDPVHPCQLDVDHKDGDKKNDAPENLQTLCANCHRLKTFRAKESGPRRFRCA